MVIISIFRCFTYLSLQRQELCISLFKTIPLCGGPVLWFTALTKMQSLFPQMDDELLIIWFIGVFFFQHFKASMKQ